MNLYGFHWPSCGPLPLPAGQRISLRSWSVFGVIFVFGTHIFSNAKLSFLWFGLDYE